MSAMLFRDLRIVYRDPRGWLASLIFFALFLSIFAIALDGEPERLAENAASAIWLGTIFSLMISFENIFDRDIQTGHFEQLSLSGINALSIVVSKMITGFITILLPILIVIPLAGILFNTEPAASAGIMMSVLFGAPALIAYSILSAALLAGQRNTGFLMILISLPFIVPVIIFALSGVASYAEVGFWNTGFQALCGISIIALTISIPAAAAALSTHLE
ncbi:MAG: hypothetical protein HKN36_01930 [Hellea sp.]|nr:hypothetical protein [Hellea sp.]